MLLFFVLPASGDAYAQPQKNTFIVTVISAEKVETLFLLSPLDYVSYLCDTVAQAKPGPDGRYELAFEANPGQRMIFSAGAQAWAAYAEPSAQCTLVLRQGMQEPFIIAPKQGINGTVSEIRTHSQDLYKRFEDSWDTLFFAMDDLRKAYLQHPDTFIRDFADYHFTYNQIDAATHLMRYDIADTLERQLLNRHRIDYAHAECLQFVQQMSLNRMMVDAMRHYCNRPEEIKAMPMPIHLLACEMQYYPNDQLRELYMLLGIKQSFQNHFYEDETAFLEFCNRVLDKVQHPMHRPIAEHLRRRYMP